MNLPSAAPVPGLIWFAEWDMGYYPVMNGEAVYDAAYFRKYQDYDASDLGRHLTHARLSLVDRWAPEMPLIDIGIGAGAFVEARNRRAPTFGWDINPIAVEWLTRRELLLDPSLIHEASAEHRMALSFWDSLEHIAEPDAILRNATWVFCSLPIFTGVDHVLKSKHFRRDEHCWYWTREGLRNWMAKRGFTLREHNTQESVLGREDIDSFAFQRVGQR